MRVTPQRGGTRARSFGALGTTASVAVTDPHLLERATAIVRRELDAVDLACSRFRPDAELCRLYRRAGTPVRVSPLLFDALRVACDVAERTDGAVDPTVGRALEALGYDRDFSEVSPDALAEGAAPAPAPGWGRIALDPRARTACVPAGVRIDLGASAKALAADRAANAVAIRLGGAVLVNLGGDVAVAGSSPEEGWPVGIAAESSASVDAVDHVVAIWHGGLASSNPGVRSWRRNGRRRHHIVDPATGASAPMFWRMVSACAPTCVEANAVTTAAVVWGEGALPRVSRFGHPARLVRFDGTVFVLNGWPSGPVGAHP